jgi:YVTN family beta-propeller protein
MRIIVCVTVAVLLSGCVRDPVSVDQAVPIPSAKGVYIVNEGTWGRGNASLSYYDLERFQVFNDVFTSVNGRSLGDVANQLVIHGNLGYIVVNNSDRIEVIDIQSNRSAGTISTGPGTSPRQIAFPNDSLALVTALYDNSVLIVGIQTLGVLGRIPVGSNPEGIAVSNGRAFVANSGLGSGTTVSVIDILGRRVEKTLRIGDNPAGVILSPDGMIYVVCAGFYDFTNPANDTPAKLKVIDPRSESVVDSLYLGGHATTLAVSPDGRGYVPTSGGGVLAIDTRSRRVVGTFATGSYYGVGVEEVTGDVYLTDPKNYVLPGEVLVFAANGQFRTRFSAGVIPGSIAFKR